MCRRIKFLLPAYAGQEDGLRTLAQGFAQKILNVFWYMCLLSSPSVALSWNASAGAWERTSLLQLEQMRYFGETQSSEQSANYTLLSSQLGLSRNSSRWQSSLDVRFEGFVEAPEELYFGVPELFVSHIDTREWQVTVGRQRRNWSLFDQEWNIGLWQPQLRWDYLAPVQQGLTGIFFDVRLAKNWQWTLFTSPVFLPDQGPQFHIKDGQFESANRWFWQPQNRIGLFGDSRSISYELDKPAEEDVLMHSSFGQMIRYDDGKSFWVQLANAYKPQNQMHIGIEGYQSIDPNERPFETVAVVHPVVIKHNIVTLETGLKSIDHTAWISVSRDQPNASKLPESWAESALTTTDFAGLTYRHFVRNPWIPRMWLQYSAMKAWEHEKPTSASLVANQVESSYDRYPFNDLIALQADATLVQSQREQLKWLIRYSYSVSERGAWLSSQCQWQINQWAWNLGVDILGSDADPQSNHAGLFTRYRSNDRVVGGLSYVF